MLFSIAVWGFGEAFARVEVAAMADRIRGLRSFLEESIIFIKVGDLVNIVILYINWEEMEVYDDSVVGVNVLDSKMSIMVARGENWFLW